MVTYDTKAKEILQTLIDYMNKQEKAQWDRIKDLYNKMRTCDDIVIDCAHKLAPYQTPKLESVEVNKKVEHRYVLQVPQPMKTKEDWMTHVGASKLTPEDKPKDLIIPKPPAPSLHDYDDSEDDEIETFKQVH
jgi:hypothetical protein